MTGTEPTLLVDQRGYTRWLTLNRRESLNAINTDMLVSILNAIEAANTDEHVRCIAFAGSRRAFSSGQDIQELERFEAERGPASVGAELRDRYAPLILKLRESPKPIIAVMSGIATGAGLALALACDLRIASEGATFITAPFRIGLMPAVGLSILIPALVGLSKAFELATLHDRVDADLALQVGLINRIARADELDEQAEQIALQLAALPQRAFAMTKAAFNAAALPNLRDHLEREVGWQLEAAIDPDHQEGMASLRERRAPNYLTKS